MQISAVSIDRCTLVGNLFKNPDGTYVLDDFLRKTPYLQTTRWAAYPYKWRYQMVDGSVIEVAEPTTADVPPVRIDFNPNKCISDDQPVEVEGELVRRDGMAAVLGCIHSARITRLDPAIDYHNCNLAEWFVIDEKARKTAVYRSGTGELETLYIGAPRSALRVRVYNKALEQKYKHGDWWRVEAQIRYGTDCEGIPAEEYLGFDPFEGVRMIKPKYEGWGWEQQAKVEYLQKHPEVFASLSAPTRSKYRKLIAKGGEQLALHPSDVFEEAKNHLREQVAYWLGLCGNNPFTKKFDLTKV